MAEVRIPNKFEGLSVDDVDSLYRKGEAELDDVLDFAASEDFRTNGLYGMDVESVDHAYRKGYLTQDQVLDYADANVSPVGFYTKDIALRAPAYGINTAIKNLVEVFTHIPQVDIHTGEQVYEGESQSLINVPVVVDEPKTLAGELVSELTEFATGFVPALGVTKATGVVQKIAQTEKMAKLATRFPLLAKGILASVEGGIAGAIPDFLNDPLEGGVSDAMDKLGVLPEYLEFMTANPENPAGQERLKRVLEGVVLGGVADAVLVSASAAARRLWRAKGGDPTKVAEAVREKHANAEPAALGPDPTPLNEPPKRSVVFVDERAVPTEGTSGSRYPSQVVEKTIEKQAPTLEDPVYRAYQELKAEGGSENVSIAELAKRSGMSPGEMQEYLTKGSSEGRAVLTLGEPVYASPDELAHGVDINGKKNLKARLDAPREDLVGELVPVQGVLPEGLSKAAPRYNGAELDFTSDVDRAIYIVANSKTSSKAHAAYTKWLKDLGVTDKEIAEYGKNIKQYIKDNLGDGDFVPVPDMEVKILKKGKRAAPAPVKEAPKAAPYKSQLSREQIRTMDPHLLTPDEYSTRLDAQRLPTTQELLDDATALSFEGVPAARVKEIAGLLKIKPTKDIPIESQIKARLMLRDALEQHPEQLLADLGDEGRRALYKEVTGLQMKPGKGTSAAKQVSEIIQSLDKMLRDVAPLFAAAKHSGLVFKAARQGREIPQHVLANYKDAKWAQEYARKKGIDLTGATRQEPQVKLAKGEDEVPQTISETTSRFDAETFGGPRVSRAAKREDFKVPRESTPPKVELDEKGLPRTTEQDMQAARILQGAGEAKNLDEVFAPNDPAFLGRIEGGSSAGTVGLVKQIYSESAELMDSFRKLGSGSFKQIEADSEKIFKTLAGLTGRHHTAAQRHLLGADKVLGLARQTFSELENKAAQAHFLNQFFTTYAKQVDDLIDKALGIEGSFEMKLKAFTHIKQLQELQALVFGIRAEGGRLLNSYNMKFQKGKFDFKNLPKEAVSELQAAKEKDIDEALKLFKNARKAKEKMMVARNVGRNPLMRGILELVQANMLWAPTTHAANILGNTANLVYRSTMRTMGLSIQALTQRDFGYIQAAGAQMAGLAEGFVAAFKFTDMTKVIRGEKQLAESGVGHFWKALWTGEGSLDIIAKEDLNQSNSILIEAFRDSAWGRPMAHVLTMPFKGLVGMDDMFKSLSYHSRLREGAFTAARQLNPQASYKEIWEQSKIMASDPSPDLHYRALKFAREVTFQEQLGQTAQAASGALERSNAGLMTKMMFMPFFKTPVNIMKQAVKNTPLGLLSKEVRGAILSSGTVEQKEMISRMLIGSAGMFGFYQLYEAGLITGRRPDEAAEDWKNAGVQEYSFWNGSKWVPYDRFEPFGMMMGMMANVSLAMQYLDAYQTFDDNDERLVKGEQLASAAILALTDATLSKTYMTSMRELIELLTGAERMNMEKMVARQTGKFLTASSLFNYWDEKHDEYVREVNEMADGIVKYQQRSDLQIARHSVYGTKVKLDPRWAGVYKTKEPSDDPVMWEFLNRGAHIRPMTRSISVKGIRRELSPVEFSQVNDILESLPLRETLRAAYDSPGYQSIQDDGTRMQVLEGILSDFRSAAKDIWLSKSPEVTEEITRKLQNRAKAIVGMTTATDPVARMNHWAEMVRGSLRQPE